MRTELLRKTFYCELAGFTAVILVLWLNELLDLPHLLLGAPATPVNITESVMETALVFLLAACVICSTRTMLKRLKVLEGLLPICSFCKKIRLDGDWVLIEKYVRDRSGADFSHTVCPHCAAEHYGDFLDIKPPKAE